MALTLQQSHMIDCGSLASCFSSQAECLFLFKIKASVMRMPNDRIVARRTAGKLRLPINHQNSFFFSFFFLLFALINEQRGTSYCKYFSIQRGNLCHLNYKKKVYLLLLIKFYCSECRITSSVRGQGNEMFLEQASHNGLQSVYSTIINCVGWYTRTT